MKQKSVYMIFKNLKQWDLLLIVFILVKINIDEVEMDQSNLLENMAKFNDKSKPKTKEGKAKKKLLIV